MKKTSEHVQMASSHQIKVSTGNSVVEERVVYFFHMHTPAVVLMDNYQAGFT